VFVFDGDNTSTGYGGNGYSMNSGERLIGEHEGLTVDPDQGGPLAAQALHPANPDQHPTLTATNADVIELDDANEVRGFNVDPSGTGGGIAGATGDVSGTIDDVNINDTTTLGTQPGLELDTTTGSFAVSNFTVTTNGATGVRLNNAGTVTFAPTGTIAITSANAAGLDTSGTTLGTSTFDTVNVTGSGSGGVRIANAGASITTFGDLALTTTSGATAALRLDSAGAVSVPAAGTANVSATGGPAIDVTGTAGATLAFDDVDSTNSASDGVNIAGLGAGTFTANNASTITNAATIDFDLDGGSGAIAYNGTITDDVGQLVRVANATAGTKDFNGNITDGGDGDGSGIALTGNTGATVRFDGGLTLATGANAAFAATGGGTVAVTDPNAVGTAPDNTLATTTATALNIANTTIHADGVNFRSISANGATSGIVLNNTGTSGGLTVAGTGGTCTSAATCTGGAIQNATGDGIVLTATAHFNVANLFLRSSALHAINATNLAGTNSLTNSLVEFWDTGNTATKNGLSLVNANTTMAAFTVTGTTFDGVSGTPANGGSNDGIFMEAQGTSSMRLTVSNSTFTHMFGDGIQVNGITGATGTVLVTVSGSTFTNAVPQTAPNVGGGNGGISLNPFGAITFRADINGNTFNDIMRPVTNLGAIGMTSGLTASADVTIRNNTLNNIVGARGITATIDGGPTELLIDNNTIDRLGSTSKFAISVNATNNASAGTVGNVDATIQNNDIGQAANLWTTGNGTAEAVFVTAQAGASLDALITNNVIDANATLEVVRARASGTGTLNVTMTNNDVADTAGAHVGELAAVAGTVSGQGGNLNASITGNTVPAGGVGVILITEGSTGGVGSTVNVQQASAAAVTAANTSATVTASGSPAFGAPAPTLPTLPDLP
jgi:hypothetical protein